MKIAFFGSSVVSAYWNGAATYYRGIIRALYDRGHDVTFYEPDAFSRQQHRDLDNPHWVRVVVYHAGDTSAVYRCLEEAKKSDVIVKASGVGVFDELLEAAVPQYCRSGALAIFWDVDAPATLDRMRSNPGDPFRRVLSDYDLILTYGGGAPVVEAYMEAGARRCVPIYNALDPSTHFPVEPQQRFQCDLAFLGNRLPDREARIEEFFLRAAEQSRSYSFVLAGNGWHDKVVPPNVRYIGHLYTADHNAFNSSPRAVLNISRDSMARYGFSPATRVFEAAGAAACIITDEWEGVEMFLEPEREIIVARSGAEVASRLALLSPQQAKVIGAAARRRILAEHTYAHRAAQVDQLLTGAAVTAVAGANREGAL